MAFKPNPVLTLCSMQNWFITGSIPGKAESTRLTWLLGSAPNLVEDDEKSFDLDKTCAWTSKPIITSQFSFSPFMK
ncbi:uncharacterized protein METZ01_LOCUS133540 [marine metagenome]|uniref:Uncharacterized protein n=1 Tax=marine metagenome TaxID=408172 RepID=A0A381YUG8_9ZZZZ